MQDLKLPEETIEFLQAGKQFEYDPTQCEAGIVTLKKYSELQLSEILVDADATPISEKDPNLEENGCFVVNSVNLVGDCPNYGAEGILIWLPDYQMFGQYDCDHANVLVFPSARWANIVSDPALYLGAEWNTNFDKGQYLELWNKYQFTTEVS